MKRANVNAILILAALSAISLLCLPTGAAASPATISASNLTFRATSIYSHEAGQRITLGGAGNLRTTGDYYFSSVASLADMGTPEYVVVDNDTIYEQRIVRFLVDTSMYTQASWDKACWNGGTAVGGSYPWFYATYWRDEYWDDVYRGEHTSMVYWNDYQLKSSVYANNFLKFSDPTIEIGWAGNLNSYEWVHPNASLGVKYDFGYRFINLFATGSMVLDDIGNYKDTITVSDQSIVVDVNNFDSSGSGLPYNQLTVNERNAMNTQGLLGQLGVFVTSNPNTYNYLAWGSPQSAERMAPQANVPLIIPADTTPNNGVTITIPSYGVKPSVYAATQRFNILWGNYAIITEGGAVGTIDCVSDLGINANDPNWLAHPTSNTHNGVERTRNVAVHLANKYVGQQFYLDMLVSCNVSLTGFTSEVYLGRPQLSQDDKNWEAFFTGDTTAGVDLLANYDWSDFITDFGAGMNRFTAALTSWIWPILGMVAVVVVLYVTVSVVRARNARRALAG